VSFRLTSAVADPLPAQLRVPVVKADPDAVVTPPETVQRRHDELVRLGIINLHQSTAVLHGHTATQSRDT